MGCQSRHALSSFALQADRMHRSWHRNAFPARITRPKQSVSVSRKITLAEGHRDREWREFGPRERRGGGRSGKQTVCTWPPEPEEPVVLEAYPAIHTCPRLTPDHPYQVPSGYVAPHNLPPGHPGEYYPDMPPNPVIYPASSSGGSTSA